MVNIVYSSFINVCLPDENSSIFALVLAVKVSGNHYCKFHLMWIKLYAKSEGKTEKTI